LFVTRVSTNKKSGKLQKNGLFDPTSERVKMTLSNPGHRSERAEGESFR